MKHPKIARQSMRFMFQKMQFFKYFLVTIVIIALLDPTEGGWLKKAFRKAKKAVKKVGKAIKKAGCKVNTAVLIHRDLYKI